MQHQHARESIFAPAFVFLTWLVLILNVQPWMREDPLSTVDTSAALKGITLVTWALIVLLAIPPRSSLRIPVPLLFFGAYGAYLVLIAMAQANPIEGALRSMRFSLALLLVVMIWTLVRGRPAMLIRAGMLAFAVLAGTVVLGLVLSPSQAWLDGEPFGAGGRLMGAYLPMMPPRVGEAGAILAGLAVILWADRRVSVTLLLPALSAGIALILLSRTRTAALALILGLAVAFALSSRSRLGKRGLLSLGATVAGALPFAGPVLDWAMREQDIEMIGKLSGRTSVWDFILSRDLESGVWLFGHGLGHKRIVLRRGEGDIASVPIDNSWISTYWETGVVGVTLIALALLAAVIYTVRTPDVLARAASLFLITYVLIASINESGLSDLSSLTLLIVLAVSISAASRFHTAAPQRIDHRNGHSHEVPA
ncbi:membrane protein [Arthrobacter tecti]